MLVPPVIKIVSASFDQCGMLPGDLPKVTQTQRDEDSNLDSFLDSFVSFIRVYNET